MNTKGKNIAPKVLRWYGKNARSFPWRGKAPPLYHVWLSEVMLQQTQTTSVIPYFEKWIKRWQNVEALAKASLSQVVAAWAGLGYYSRARSLHKTAKIISQTYGGVFPAEAKLLKALPGVGDYTAAALLAFGFGTFAVVVDGNIKRILSRVFAIPFEDEKKIKKIAETQTPQRRAGDYAQALMDIGATICLPQKPLCAACPLAKECLAHQREEHHLFGRRKKTKPKPHRVGKVYLIENQGAVLVVTRLPRGLLGGTLAFPSTGWDGSEDRHPLKGVRWKKHQGKVAHTFTHFELTLTLYSTKLTAARRGQGKWRKNIKPQELSSLMKKVWLAYRAEPLSGR